VRIQRLSIGILVIAAAASPVRADPERREPEVPRLETARPFDPRGWTLLGSRGTTIGRIRDVVPLARSPEPVNQIALVVDGGELHVERVVIRFDDGTSLSPRIDHRFRARAIQRVVDLGPERTVVQVGVRYRVAPRDVLTIKLYGRKIARTLPTRTLIRTGVDVPRVPMPDAGEDAGDPYEGWDRRGWRFIAVKRVDDGSDWDSIRIAADRGAFGQIALVARGGELDLHDLRLRFGSGPPATIGTRHRFRAGSRVRVVDLPGVTRPVTSIQVHTGRLDDRPTRIEIWAR
jgi:hypothetical protein